MDGQPRLHGDVAGVRCEHAVAPGRSTIGCIRGNALVLPVRGVSRRHAELVLEGDDLRIVDLGSRNGLRVNGVRVQTSRLQHGDSVRIGPVQLRLEWGQAGRLPAPAAAGGALGSVGAAMLAAGCLVAQLVLGKTTRDALFLALFDVEVLPTVMACSSALAILVVLYLSRAHAGQHPGAVAVRLCGIGAASLLGLWALALGWPRLAALILYAYTVALGAALLSCFWAVVNERFDPRAARRLVGRIAGGSSAGGLVGGMLAWASAGRVPTTSMLPAMAMLTAVAGLAIRQLAKTAVEQRAAEGPSASSRDLLAGVRVLREVGYLRVLAGIVALSTAVEALLDYAFKAQAVAVLARPQLLGFFAVFHTGTGLATLAGQAFAAGAVLERLGLTRTMALAPGGVACAAAAAFATPGLSTAVVARGGQFLLHSSFFRPGYELCFSALPAAQRRPAKIVVDVGADKLGAIAGAALILVVAGAGASSPLRALLALAVLGSLAVLGLSRRLHAGYVRALADNLRSGALVADGVEARDATTRLTLVAFAPQPTLRLHPGAASDPIVVATSALRSSDPAVVRAALLAQDLDPRLAPHILPLLARSDLGSAAVRALHRLASRTTGLLVDGLLSPDLPLEARLRLPSVLRSCAGERARDGLLLGLTAPELPVRRLCARALLRLRAGSSAPALPTARVMSLVRNELAAAEADRQRSDAGASADQGVAQVFDLLALALDPSAIRSAYRAVTGRAGQRGIALEYLENVLPREVRDRLWVRLGEISPSAP